MVTKIFSMFSGYGGAEFALQKANISYKVIGFSEIDKHAIQIYKQNHGDIKNYGDATKIEPEKLEDFDLLTGGFPCQAFSITGNRKGFTDARGTLFNDIVRILEVKEPKYFLLENVEGLLSHDDGRTFEIIINALKETGYYVKWKLLNSKHYGTPQNRSRIFFVGFLHKEDFELFDFPKECELNYGLKDLLEKEVDNKYYLTEKQIESIKNRNRYGDYLIDDINKEKVHKCLCEVGSTDVGIFNTDNFIDNNNVSKTLTAGGRNCGNNLIVGDFRYDEEFRERKDGNSPTLCSSIRDNSISGGMPLVNPNNKFRKLTPTDCFRLMGFYNDEIDLSNISNSQLYKLAGNGWEINIVSKIFYEMFYNKTKKGLNKWF